MNIKAEQIISCEFFNEEETYDIGVGHPEHNFLTDNGIIVSNSFNKSHATSYSAVAYIDAYFKAKYPLVFYKVLCDFEDDRQTLSQFFTDAKMRGVNVGTFDINRSNYEFDIDVETNTLLPGFKMIKGISKKIVDNIIEERNKNGKFESIVDFFLALDNISFNIKTIEPLIMLGALDELYPNRRMLFQLFDLFKVYQAKKKLKTESKRIKFEDIFKQIKEYDIEDMSLFEKLEYEQKYLEMYLLENPIAYANKWYKKQGVNVCSISEREDENDNVLAIITDFKIKKTKNKKPYLELVITDQVDIAKVKVWENKMSDELQKKGAIICCRLEYQELFNSYTLITHHILEN